MDVVVYSHSFLSICVSWKAVAGGVGSDHVDEEDHVDAVDHDHDDDALVAFEPSPLSPQSLLSKVNQNGDEETFSHARLRNNPEWTGDHHR